MSAWKVAVAAAKEPVGLETAKLHCRVDIDDDDTLIEGLIQTAREWVEDVARRALITQSIDLVMDAFPGVSWINLPRPPLQSVTHIKYTDSDGNESTFSSDSYMVDTYEEPGRIVLNDGYSWPGDTLRAANGVTIRFVAGYGDEPEDVPQKYRQAILLLVGHWYENREAVSLDMVRGGAMPVPMAVKSLVMVDRNWG